MKALRFTNPSRLIEVVGFRRLGFENHFRSASGDNVAAVIPPQDMYLDPAFLEVLEFKSLSLLQYTITLWRTSSKNFRPVS